MEPIILLTFFFFVLSLYFYLKYKMTLVRIDTIIEEKLRKKEKEIREDAIKRSLSVISGKVIEKLIPLVKKFPFNPRDVRWIGDPVDLVIFDGYSKGKVNEIIFCEVKSGLSRLNPIQRSTKDAVIKKKVKWLEVFVK